jgi:hypothetical protein
MNYNIMWLLTLYLYWLHRKECQTESEYTLLIKGKDDRSVGKEMRKMNIIVDRNWNVHVHLYNTMFGARCMK